MPRVRKGAARTQARKRILRRARGYYGTKHRHKYQAENALIRAGVYAFRDRRQRKRDYRGLWIIRITAACKTPSSSTPSWKPRRRPRRLLPPRRRDRKRIRTLTRLQSGVGFFVLGNIA
jgi:hypothetical protein